MPEDSLMAPPLYPLIQFFWGNLSHIPLWLNVAQRHQPGAIASLTHHFSVVTLPFIIVVSLKKIDPLDYLRISFLQDQDEDTINYFMMGSPTKMQGVTTPGTEHRNGSGYDDRPHHRNSFFDGHPCPPITLVVTVQPLLSRPPGFSRNQGLYSSRYRRMHSHR